MTRKSPWTTSLSPTEPIRESERGRFRIADRHRSKKVEFADFSLDYLFETLNINYVTFGNATGKALAAQVLNGHPIALTDGLTVEKPELQRGAVLGDYSRALKAYGTTIANASA